MNVKVIGSEVKAGQFTDEKTGKVIDYNNLYLHCVEPVAPDIGFGFAPVSLKLKNENQYLNSVFGFIPTAQDLADLENKEISVYYNQYGRIDSIFLPSGDEK